MPCRFVVADIVHGLWWIDACVCGGEGEVARSNVVSAGFGLSGPCEYALLITTYSGYSWKNNEVFKLDTTGITIYL